MLTLSQSDFKENDETLLKHLRMKGLQPGEGLRLAVADIDARRLQVHVRDSKGNKDGFLQSLLSANAVGRR